MSTGLVAGCLDGQSAEEWCRGRLYKLHCTSQPHCMCMWTVYLYILISKLADDQGSIMWDVGTLVCAWLLSSVNTLLLVTTYRAQVPSPSPPVSRCRASCCWGRGWGCCSPPPPPARWWPPCRATAASRGGNSSWWPSSSPPPWCGSWVSSWGAAVMQLVSIQLCAGAVVAAASACVALPAVLGYTGASRPSKLCLGLVRGHTGHGHTTVPTLLP